MYNYITIHSLASVFIKTALNKDRPQVPKHVQVLATHSAPGKKGEREKRKHQAEVFIQ